MLSKRSKPYSSGDFPGVNGEREKPHTAPLEFSLVGADRGGSVMLNGFSSQERFLRPRASGRHAVTYQGR